MPQCKGPVHTDTKVPVSGAPIAMEHDLHRGAGGEFKIPAPEGQAVMGLDGEDFLGMGTHALHAIDHHLVIGLIGRTGGQRELRLRPPGRVENKYKQNKQNDQAGKKRRQKP